jgi:hypothetical protein
MSEHSAPTRDAAEATMRLTGAMGVGHEFDITLDFLRFHPATLSDHCLDRIVR